jgi:hypothetical protein
MSYSDTPQGGNFKCGALRYTGDGGGEQLFDGIDHTYVIRNKREIRRIARLKSRM